MPASDVEAGRVCWRLLFGATEMVRRLDICAGGGVQGWLATASQ